MAVINGNVFLLKVNPDVSERYIVGVTSNSIEVTADMIDITTKDSAGWATFIPGRVAATISLNFLYDPEEVTKIDIINLFSAWKDGTLCTLTLGQWTTGDQQFTCSGYLTSLSIDANQNDAAGCSATFQVTGAIAQVAYNP